MPLLAVTVKPSAMWLDMVGSWRPIEPARSPRSWSTAGSSSIKNSTNMAVRFVKLIGDGALAEFVSFVDAVEFD
jgi:hypothetical protein